ncbi:DUF5320 domain-containing protein [Puia dinghuensis]|uniref:Vitellogenin II n=1 Tax=Puia dinghuensis TaxID=1792502 RepID=A0A8J2XR75_9BACT|nr:DUF5320 domain-containing protein [Puia dinghuensis]GGA88009.1 hypothetical protein GCM10011511_08940 [Puia dinghuensis]
MKHLFPLIAFTLVIGATGCSSSRNAQTTDDVYYSSGSKRPAAAAANNDEYYSTAPSDNYVRMKAQDPARWSYFDDYNAYDSYYYSPVTASMGFGYGYPAYGFGYGLGYPYGMGFGYGLGFYDPYLCWNSYFLWNSWYNPYFYNPYYGGGVFVVSHSTPTAIYSNLRPFNSVAYHNGISHHTGTTSYNNRFYRPGMSTTSTYNSSLTGQGRQVNNTYYRPGSSNSNGGYRPYTPSNNNGGYRPAPSFSQPTRSYSPSFGGGGGGGGGFSRPGHH